MGGDENARPLYRPEVALSHAMSQGKPISKYLPLAALSLVAACLLVVFALFFRSLATPAAAPKSDPSAQPEEDTPSIRLHAGRPPTLKSDPAAPGRRY